jgi:hypothetical protein
MTNTKLRSQLLAFFLTTLMSAGLVSGQTAQTAAATDEPLAMLPASDGIMFLDTRRIMTEIIPRLFAGDPAMLAKLMGVLNETSTKSGVNLLSISRVVVGVRFLGPLLPTAEKENIGIVVIVRGDSHANSVIEVVKRETKGKFAEETYGGKVIYSEPPPTPPRKRTERATPAVAMIDADTIVAGDLPQVRAAIDAISGSGRVDSSLVELATRDQSALLGSAINLPDSLKQNLTAGAPKDEMTQGIVKLINNIKVTYNSLGATPAAYNVTVGARFESPEQAQSINDMLIGLRQQAGSFVKDQQIRGLIDGVQITAQGAEVQIKCDIKSEVVQEFLTSMMKDEKKSGAAAKASPAKVKRTIRTRRSRRRTRSR